MAHLKKRGNILWIRYYDKLTETRKEFSTKIKATKEGWIEARKLLRQFEAKTELHQEFIEITPNIDLLKGKEEFLSLKRLKPKTIMLYDLSTRVLIEAAGNKKLSQYDKGDYRRLLMLFDKKSYSNNTQGIYTAHLHAMFEFFKASGYVRENFVKMLKKENKIPESIDDRDLQNILRSLYNKEAKEQFYLIMFLLITGFRISSALALKWEDVDWENNVIIARNVKRGRDFLFPITNDVRSLLNEIGIRKDLKVFSYSMNGLKFFFRLQQKLLEQNLISKKYTLHQLRKTFITKLLEKGIPLHIVKTLADHTNINTTMKYYASVNVKKMKEEIDTRSIFGDILGGNKRLVG